MKLPSSLLPNHPRARRASLAFLALAAAAVVAVIAGLASKAKTAEASRPPAGNFSADHARAFTEFGVFDVGAAFRGMNVSGRMRVLEPLEHSRPVRANYVTTLYGDCGEQAAASHGCLFPLEIQAWPSCERNQSVYSPLIMDGVEYVDIRGTEALYFGHLGRPRIELTTGSTTVVIFGASKELVVEAAKGLRGINNETRPSDRLLAPPRGITEGTIRCDYDDSDVLLESP